MGCFTVNLWRNVSVTVCQYTIIFTRNYSAREIRDLQRVQIIEVLIGQSTLHRVEAAIGLWNQLAKQIITIIGEAGFSSLYARSVALTQAAFPWLEVVKPSTTPVSLFARLKKNFQAQIPVQANNANNQLLIIFTDMLASLIGEELTTFILKSSWSHDITERAKQARVES